MSAITTYTVHRSGGMIEVTAKLPSGRPCSVTATNYSHYGGPPEFEVNWSALGSVSAEDAAAYATLVAFVAEHGLGIMTEPAHEPVVMTVTTHVPEEKREGGFTAGTGEGTVTP